MKMKSYFASTVEAAMALARQELGPDAMLVNSRRTTEDTRQLGEYEVVFALLPADVAPPPAATPAALEALPAQPDAVARLSIEISGLKQRIDRMSTHFARARVAADGRRIRPDAAQLLSVLLDSDVDEEAASDIACRAAECPSTTDGLASVLGDLIRFDPTLGRAGRSRRVVALVGPPGSGKTTTLVKFAARFGVAAKRPMHILSADTVRIAASDQLRAYSTILGSSFQCAETAHALSLALDEHRHKDFILIDTPGLSARDLDTVRDLAELLSTHPDIDVHLTVPASMRAADLSRVVSQYEMFHPRKLIFTRLDEASTAGILINEAIRTGLPVSFLATGQQVPEDLEPASASILAGLLRRGMACDEVLVGAGYERG